MTEADQPEEETLSKFRSLNDDAIQSLLAMLDLSQGFTIAFAECNFWQDGVALVAALNEEIASDPEWEELQLESWEFNDPDLRYLLDELVKRLETLPRQDGKKLVLVLSGLENAIGVVGDYPPFLVDLNFVRDAYARIVPHPVVFVLPDYAITRVANFAPDFWAWKSSVFKFQTSQEAKEFAEDKTINSDRILGSYIKPEKQERINLLHRLLTEANPSVSDSESNRNPSTQIDILIELGNAYDSLSEFNRAVEFYNLALKLSQKIGDQNRQANALNGLGSAYRDLGQYQQSIHFFQQSLEIAIKIGDWQGQAKNFNGLGIAHLSIKQYQQAISFYAQAIAIKKEIGDRHGEAISLSNLGNVYSSLKNYEQAIKLHQQSLEIFREFGDLYGEASSSGNLGSTYALLGDYQKAVEFYHKTLEVFQEIGDQNGEANSLVNLGSAYASLGYAQKAIHFFRKSLEIKREIGDRHGEATSLKNLGLTLQALGRRGESIEAFNASRKIYEELGLYHNPHSARNGMVKSLGKSKKE